MENKQLRMYFFVMYNLSGIQKGIQAGHSALEYATEHGKTKQYKEFVKNHKTFILLDGGGSKDMAEREYELDNLGIKYSTFFEPDLNESLSAIAFILDEDQFNCKIDPDVDRGLTPKDLQCLETYEYIRKFRLASN